MINVLAVAALSLATVQQTDTVFSVPASGSVVTQPAIDAISTVRVSMRSAVT